MFYVAAFFFCSPLCLDCVIQCQTAVKSESTPLLSPSTSIRMNLSLTRASTCSTEPSLQRAVSKIWCFLATVTVCQVYMGWHMLPVCLQPVPASFAVETDAASLWGRCVMEWKTAQTDGTRLDAVCLLPEDCRFDIKDMTCATLRFVCFFLFVFAQMCKTCSILQARRSLVWERSVSASKQPVCESQQLCRQQWRRHLWWVDCPCHNTGVSLCVFW